MPLFTYKCPNCGGALAFNSAAQNWKCEYCLDVFYNREIKDLGESDITGDNNPELETLIEEVEEQQEIEDLGEIEEDAEQQEIEDFESDSKARIYSCTNCGTEVITDEATPVAFCYYCHSTAISPGQLSGIHRPSKVIPFKITRDTAMEAFTNWYKKIRFLSVEALAKAERYKLTGIYVPFWRFDCKIIGKISAEAANDRSWINEGKVHTESDIYDVSRTATAQYRGIPANGSKKASDRLMEELGPYDYTQMEDFSMSHLSGYMAAKYDMDYDEVFAPISDCIQEHSNKLLQDTIYGYNHVTVKNSSIDIKKKDVDCVLLPIWMFTYDYNGRKYMFAMNGQTGKIIGSLPISRVKIAAWFCVISTFLFAIFSAAGGM